MTTRKRLILALSFALLFSVSAAAQRSRRNTTPTARPATAKPAPTPAAPATLPANTLAVVNGQIVTFDDIDVRVRDAVNNLDRNISEMRRRALTDQINSFLFEAEAKKRNVTIEEFLNTEIYSRIPPPSEEEIRYIYENNRDQLGPVSLEEARPRIVNAIREQRASSLIDDLATRLRMMYVVEWGNTDVNAQNVAPATVLASVSGRAITYGDLNEQLKPSINDLRMRLYEAERQAVEDKVNEILLDIEARRRGITRDDLIRVEIFSKLRRPTDADVANFYEANRANIKGTLAERRAEIASFLEGQERARLEQALADRLRSTAQIRMLLAEPAGYVQKISTDDDPSRGPASAPVTVVMFTDFQCPACSATHPVLDEVLKRYGSRVRLVVRDFPLDMHKWARKAAEAANAANAQGKFFEYISILYRNQQALDVPSLKKYASDLGLDRARFDADLDSGKYAAEVNHDVADGKSYGITGTPTIFINGVRLLDLSDIAMRAALDRAMERAGQKPQTAATK
ncbi:MAG: thioredoxin domain-containing protein [Pyrinomonadaceae bacterium]|nr:thioredoxin domain-containing protein [Pyrinomonadaceae bacterium]